MAPAARLCLALPLRSTCSRTTTRAAAAAAAQRALHTHPAQPARVVPVYGTGPPPEPPLPSAEFAPTEDPAVREERLARRRRQAELLKHAGDIKALRQQQQQDSAGGKGKTAASDSGLKRRFWKDVHVREVNGALEIHLDARPLRHPTTKAIIRLPTSKPYLAHALALEWDNLVSASQATRQHLIPLTSLTCRALDIASDDAATSTNPNATYGAIRTSIAQTLLRYLDTDSLLCFSPPPSPGSHNPDLDGPALHEQQHQAYTATTHYLTTHLWPGISIVPVLDESTSILPRQQPAGTREAVQSWILSLPAFELACLERATLAGKSLLVAARLVGEWTEQKEAVHHQHHLEQEAEEHKKKKFGVEEAARAVSLEVDWQTGTWGEVEDTHDVEREDLRRQLGSVVLLVTGSGRRGGDGSKSS